jgi:hypothetical protein
MDRHKWQGLTMRQKIGFIRDYYIVHIIAAVFAVAAVGWALNHYVFNPPPRTFVNISFYGQFVSEDLRGAMAQNLTNSLVDEDANYVVVVDNFFTTGDMQFDMAMAQRMVAMMTAREVDILIIAPGEADEYIERGFARDLSDMLPAPIIELLGSIESFCFFSNLARQFGVDFQGWTLIVVSNTVRDEQVSAFLDYILVFYELCD